MSDAGKAKPARKQLKPFQKRVVKQARAKAAAEGIDWKSLSQDDRKLIKTEVRGELKAKRAAKKAPGAGA
jgi:hypothetical protein